MPVIVGVFWGAPLVARELEDGTHRLIWSQGVTRGRWLATKLGLTALATVVVVGGLSLAITWWSAPVNGALSRTDGSLPSRMTPVTFAMRGLVPVAWAVFAFTLGVLLGLVLRRVLVTMAVTLVLVVAMQVAWPFLVSSGGGRPTDLPASQDTSEACLASLASKGYRFQLTYEPISRFWALQWIETGVLLALSAALAGGAGWRIRRDVG